MWSWKALSFSNMALSRYSSQQKTIINAMAVNDEGVMATGGKKFELCISVA